MIFLFKRLLSKYKKIKIWRKYGNKTFYHLDNGSLLSRKSG